MRHTSIRHCGIVGRVPAFQPSGPGSIPGGVRNFNSYPGIGCVFFVFFPVLSPAEALTLCWPHIQGGPSLCISLVFWSIDNCSPYRHLTHGHLGSKYLGCKSYAQFHQQLLILNMLLDYFNIRINKNSLSSTNANFNNVSEWMLN